MSLTPPISLDVFQDLRKLTRWCRQQKFRWSELRVVTTTPFTVTTEDMLLVDDDTAGATTINLPGPSIGFNINIKKLGSTGNVTVSSSSLIDGSATFVMTTQYQNLTLVADGTNWNIV